jgi:hypothetical protein
MTSYANPILVQFLIDTFSSPAGDCLECVNKPNKRTGYSWIPFLGKRLTAHRAMFMAAHGDPGDLFVLHRCDNRRCMRPEHLFSGTHGDNMDDMQRKGRSIQGRSVNAGCDNGNATLSEAQVNEIRQLGASGVPHVEIASRFSISGRHAGRIVNGQARQPRTRG